MKNAKKTDPVKTVEPDKNALKRNDKVGPDDDTLGENTEETPIAEEIHNDKNAGEKQTPAEEL